MSLKKVLNNATTIARFLLLVTFLVISLTSPLNAQGLDETWTVTVNGQTVQVNPDGSFRIPNISSADQFGLGGPGTRPDFLSDDFLRAIGVSTSGGVTHYAFSEPFQIRSGETFIIGEFTFTDIPPPFPDALKMSVDDPTLTAIGQTTQLHVTGVLVDDSEIDVTPRTAWTIYRTSNPSVATVGENGLVTATGAGTVFMTAVNEGTTAVKRILVVPGDPLTTVEGFVQLEDGTPVVGADVTLLAMSEITGVDGFFQITGVPTQLGISLNVRASILINSETFRGTKEITTTVPGGTTDAGIITVKASQFRLIGSSSIQGTNPGSIFEIDIQTGEAILIGTPQNTQNGLSDVAFDSGSGTLYAMHGGSGRGAELLNLDLDNGALLNRISVINPLRSFTGSDALVFNDAGTLFMGFWSQGRLATIDPTTGIVLSDLNVTGSGGNEHLADLAFDPTTGNLWATRGNSSGGQQRLLILDPGTASATFILDQNSGPITGIAFGPDGTLYGSVGGSQLAIIDKETGNATFIGTGFGGPKISGLGAIR